MNAVLEDFRYEAVLSELHEIFARMRGPLAHALAGHDIPPDDAAELLLEPLLLLAEHLYEWPRLIDDPDTFLLVVVCEACHRYLDSRLPGPM